MSDQNPTKEELLTKIGNGPGERPDAVMTLSDRIIAGVLEQLDGQGFSEEKISNIMLSALTLALAQAIGRICVAESDPKVIRQIKTTLETFAPLFREESERDMAAYKKVH